MKSKLFILTLLVLVVLVSGCVEVERICSSDSDCRRGEKCVVVDIKVNDSFESKSICFKECTKDSDCFCNCCQYEAKNVDELNEHCAPESMPYWELSGFRTACEYTMCPYYEEQYDIKCIKNECKWVER